jgi:hypothetical protein
MYDATVLTIGFLAAGCAVFVVVIAFLVVGGRAS